MQEVTFKDLGAHTTIPRVGMLATVRNRRGVISGVEPVNDSKSSALLHLVTIEFSDADGDSEESLLWERERSPMVLEPNALPRIDREVPMQQDEFLALQRAARWSALTPFLSASNPAERSEPVPIAPVYGAGSVDDFQLWKSRSSRGSWSGPSRLKGWNRWILSCS